MASLLKKASLLGCLLGLGCTLSLASEPGAAVYKSKCASCHGVDGKGQTAIGKKLNLKDLASSDVQNKHHSELKLLIENGKGKMPAYKDKLTNEQIEKLVTYIRSVKQK
jgi:mono/diheme cytochrome c family protein